MNRPPFAVWFAISLAIAALLPLYVEQTMTRVMYVGGQGDAIEWSWKLCTLRTFFADYRYFRHHPHPELWIALNVALALIYASVASLVATRALRHKTGPSS
ncbi:MAG TPA: hypothetical protein VEX43_12410 [Chthoniobacterales bacterium]|nr:hypothetical protein [Chthoniobacterales bacterium]